MAKLKAVADLSIADNGSVNLAVDAVDAGGVKTAWPSGAPAPTAAEVDPAGAPGPSFDVPNAVTTPTPTGYVVNVKVLQPPPQPLVTGIGFTLTVASGFPNQTAPITVTADGLADIVGGPASTFVAAESAGN